MYNILSEQWVMWPKKCQKRKTNGGGGDFKEIGETEEPEIEHTPKNEKKENLEDKLIEL